jgi:cell wall-associated NlpC family hydrolase
MHLFLVMALLAASASQAVVVKPAANMFSQPDGNADVVSQAIYGTNIGVIEEQQGWLRIRTPDDYTGWVPASDVRRLGAGGKAYASAGRVARIESLFAHIYRDPDVTKHAPLITVPFETRLEVIAEPADNERWLQVRLPDERSGWLQRGDVTFDPKPLSIEAAIALSRRFLGLPYTWGGASSFGYDCSGFTQMLCRRRGVLIPRDAGPQAAWRGVVPVDRAGLQPGDLLFFGRSAGHITHTGMYIGEGQFINATTWIRPVVQISDLRDAHWSRLLVACRRLK